MRRAHGFTLFEAMVVLAVAAVLATAAFSYSRFAFRNASLASATHDLAMRLSGLRAAAMAEGKDQLVVLVDAPSNDATGCGAGDLDKCAAYHVLRDPASDWSLGGFDPAKPWEKTNGEPETIYLPRTVRLDLTAAGKRTIPAPFSGVTVHESGVIATRGSTQRCVAVRFGANGQVRVESPSGGDAGKPGLAFTLGTDQTGDAKAADRRTVMITAPVGIVKTYAF